MPAQPDSGTDLPQGTIKTYAVTLSTYDIQITPELNIAPGDRVVFRVRCTEDAHGFQLDDPAGNTLIPARSYGAGEPAVSFSFTASTQGTYTYACTVEFCGFSYMGHWSMFGSFDVGTGTVQKVPPVRPHHHH